MSDETKRALAEAEATKAQQHAVVDRLKQAALDSVAAGLGEHLDVYAKKMAQAQPDVTKSLGRDGVSALRAELAKVADELGAELRQSSQAIKWPTFEFGVSRNKGVASALFDLLYGSRMMRIDQIFKSFGYTIEQHGGLNPHSLYGRDDFTELETEISVHTSYRQAADAARAADNHDTVESLWDETDK
jgi:hypothetical protein